MQQIEYEDGRLLLYTHYEERQKAASLPGARWNPVKKCWSVPATPAVWRRITERWHTDHDLPVPIVEPKILKLQGAMMTRDVFLEHGPDDLCDYEHQTIPWKHQTYMTNMVHSMDAALLDAWMGTGKTKAVLDALMARSHQLVLVVCPTSAVQVWKDEMRKHWPGTWHVADLYGGSITERTVYLQAMIEGTKDPRLSRPLIVLVNYEAYWRGALGKAILAHTWDCVVLDESHRIKSPGAKCSRFAAQLARRAKHKICLTGTPMPHSPLDLYGQYRFLDPGIFGTRFAAFRDRYAVMGGYENKQVVAFRNQDELRKQMDRLCLHVGKDVLDLPPLQFIDRRCVLEARVRKVYDELKREFVAQVEDGIITATNAMVKLLRLQQITGGWIEVSYRPMTVNEYGEPKEVPVHISVAKQMLLEDMLRDLEGERVVVFARFRRDLDTIHDVCAELSRSCGEISGREKHYYRWKLGEFDTLAVQTQTGSLGIDLTEARVGIFYSLGYSLGDYEQCYSRLHRPGQGRPTVIYRLLAEDTVDFDIVKALDKRRDVIESILSDVRRATSGTST